MSFEENIEEEEEEYTSQPQGLRWPAPTGKPSLGAGGDLVIPESIPRLSMRTRPLLPQRGLYPPLEQDNWRQESDATISTSTSHPEAGIPHL